MKDNSDKFNHTQGVWKVNSQERKIESPKGTICQLYSHGSTTISDEEAEANAQRIVKCVNGWDGLIATIKDMLKEAEDACMFHGNNPDKSPDIIKWRKFLKQAEQK